MDIEKLKHTLKRIWHFLVHEDSWQSFLADAIIILIVGKFILFPAFGFVMGTEFPAVAVISGSMDHDGQNIDEWWAINGAWYEARGLTKEDFAQFDYVNGFEKGDVLIIKGVDNPEVGDVIVYDVASRRDPIIHRVISEEPISTKGDANFGQLFFENNVSQNQIQGKAIFIIPKIGWIKVAFVELIS